MVMLVTLAEVKAMARVDFIDDDAIINELILAASDAVLDYLKPRGYAGFYDGTALTAEVPKAVKTATAYLAREFFYDSETEKNKSFEAYGGLPRPVVAMLYRKRDPAIA